MHQPSPTSSTIRNSWLKLCAGAATATFTALAWPSTAAAETTVGVDLALNDSIAGDDAGTGAGVDIIVGPRLNLAILTLTTELSAGFHDFGGAFDPAVYRGMVGGRLGIGVVIRPSVFAHIGAGHLRFDDPFGDGRDGRTNVATDVGAALDFTVLPLVDLGIQGSYNFIGGTDVYEPFEWLQAGAHVTFVLDS